MKVRITASVASHEHFSEHNAMPEIGSVVEVPEEVGRQYIEAGLAVAPDENWKPEPERTSVSTPGRRRPGRPKARR